MDPMHEKLKALKPDEPDDEIEKDLATIRKVRPGITDDEIYSQAQALVQGGGKMPSPAAGAPPAPPASPGGPSGVVAPPAAPPVSPPLDLAPAPAAPAYPPMDGKGPLLPSAATQPPASSGAPQLPPTSMEHDDGLGPHKLGGDDAAMAALQGLAGIGDVIGNAYGGQHTEFLKQAQGAEAGELAKRKAVSEELRAKRGEGREDRKLDIEQSKVNAEMMKAKLEAMKKGGKETFDMEEQLRDDFAKSTQSYTIVRDQMGIMQAAAKDPSAAGDLAVIFSFMKMVDPTSSVREGEFSNAQNSAGVPDRVRNLYNNALTGQRFDPKVRADFLDQAGKLFGSKQQTFDSDKKKVESLAESYGLNKDRVTGAVTGAAPAPGASTAPAAGDAPKVASQAEYDRLAPGAEYIAPDGTRKRKK